MLFRSLAEPLPPALQDRGVQSLLALESLNGYDQLELASRQLMGILRAARPTFAVSQDRQKDFDALCDELLDWLETEIAPLRFETTHLISWRDDTLSPLTASCLTALQVRRSVSLSPSPPASVVQLGH